MNAEEHLTTDELIIKINSFPKVYAVRNRTYGVCVYQDYESYKKDKASWFMTIDPKATSIAQPFGCNFEGWPEDWSDSDYWSMSVDEAITQMELLDHDFFAFVNEANHRHSVVYIRKDGGYGVIETKE